MRPGRIGLAALASGALYALVLGVTAATTADRPTAVLVIAVLAGAAWVVAGLVALVRRPDNRTGWLMLAAGDLWALSGLQYGSSEVVFTIGAVAGQLAFGPWIHVTLAFPDGRLRERLDRILLSLAYGALLLFPLLTALFDETPIPTCDGCEHSAIVVRDSPAVAETITALGTLTGIVLSAAFIGRLLRRFRAATPPMRRVLRPVYLTSVAGLVAIIVVNLTFALADDRAGLVAGAIAVVFFGAVPLAFLAGLLRVRLQRGAIAELTTSLGAGTPLREALVDALGDPSLTIAYPLADGVWVDESGRSVGAAVAAEGRTASPVEHEGELVAILIHDSSLDDDPELVQGVAGAAALALRTQRLQAQTRAQYAFLETLVDTAPSLFLHIDLDGRVRNQNAAAVAAAGLDDEELIRGRPFWDVFIDPAERDAVIARFRAAAPDFPEGEYQNAFVNARGERRVVFWRSAPIKAEDGTVQGIISGGIDVTEREEEAEARERERIFLNAIANNAPSLLCLIDADGVVAPFATNRAFDDALELDPDTVGGEIFWERYVAPEDADAVRRTIARIVAGETVDARDDVWLTTTGRRVDVSWSCTPLPQLDERRLFLVCGTDITERRSRELELQSERDATTVVLQSIPSVVAVLDHAGVIRDRDTDNPRAAVNRAFREALGWRDVELIGRNLLDLVVDDDGRAAAAIAEAASGLVSDVLETGWLCADGSVRIFSWSAVPVPDVTGRMDSLVLVSGVDVTERHERELEDLRRRAFIDAIGNATPSYLLVLEEDATVRADGANPAFEEAFGWTAAELAGQSFVGAVTPASDFPARMLIANAANGVVQGEIESRWDARDGESRIVAWNARPVPGISGERLVLVSGVDVTLRRLQEEELRASRARIVGAADDARRRLERDLHDGAQQRLVALSVALRLAESRLTAGGDGVPEMLAAARAELGLALEELRELARGIHPAILTDRGLKPALEALVARTPMPVTLEHEELTLPAPVEAAAYFVVAEALTNVVKYAEASSATVTIALEDGCVHVSVRDDGIGGAEAGSGSGLRGLADRVAALDGRLVVESPPGEGTCVRAELPIGRQADEAGEAAAEPQKVVQTEPLNGGRPD